MSGAGAADAALICGSMAYDTIMVFNDRFANHILPDKIHLLNVSFLVPQMRREFGGCAGNIAYNLSLRGELAVDGAQMLARDAAARRPTSPPTSTTTRSPPFTPARCSTRTSITSPRRAACAWGSSPPTGARA